VGAVSVVALEQFLPSSLKIEEECQEDVVHSTSIDSNPHLVRRHLISLFKGVSTDAELMDKDIIV
jgi:hypothetical protein